MTTDLSIPCLRCGRPASKEHHQPPDRKCRIPDCNKASKARGLCQFHARRLAHGIPFSLPVNYLWGKSITARFWPKVEKTPTCWLWKGDKHQRGYGLLTVCKEPRDRVRAHRLSWELHIGSIPEGLQVLHRCDVPACVNPAHLFLGTQADNLADMRRKGRGVAPPVGARGQRRV